ncbi:MAG: hypothetical protein AAGA61_08600, partial [Pseudomonadota bacterium]
HAWAWPILEIAHFSSLCVLFGCLAPIDLRLAGLGANIPASLQRRLILGAIAAFVVNATSGGLFFTANATKYIDNPAFELKLVLIGLAGCNAVFHHWRLQGAADGVGSSAAARVVGVLSLLLWSGVIICGRMITFYAP